MYYNTTYSSYMTVTFSVKYACTQGKLYSDWHHYDILIFSSLYIQLYAMTYFSLGIKIQTAEGK